ncbi:MAG: Ig-like domain-containing protein [Candidatus Peregrinibacteria bacterium]
MTKKTFGFGVALAMVLQVLFMPVVLADPLPVRVYANDTVAGYATSLKSSLVNPGQNVVFVVEGPNGAVNRISAQADLSGVAQAELFGHLTKIAGSYRVALVYPGSSAASPQSTFAVYADAVSPTQSIIAITDALVTADGISKTFVTVTLYDAYRNPVKGHAVQLISSRFEDVLASLNGGVTDENGRANFQATSNYPGLSVLTALDNTISVVLGDREEVVFQAPAVQEKGIGGTLLRANLFSADITGTPEVTAGPVDHFVIEGLTATVKINEELNVTVVAKDRDDNTAKNYTGTILFAVPDDENAVLPGNGQYSFKETDQGKFTFNLALQFTRLGKQTLQVYDKDNWDILGEAEVEVVSRETISPAARGSTLAIKSPADGAELGNSLVVLTGQGDPNINLKVFDNDVKVGDSETDEGGFFTYEARSLSSGAHTFYVMSESGDVSPSVNIQIDTLPPVINAFYVMPDGTVMPGAALTVTLQSEPDLEEVKIRIQGMEEEMLPSADPGTYKATLAAPTAEGNFPLDVILVDKLANRAELLNRATIQVALPKPAAPAAVSGLSAEAGDAAVTLHWEPVTGDKDPVARYRVYFGTHFNELNQTMDTQGALSTLVISGLTNDTQYFFAVKAVNSKGTESESLSLTVAATPKSAVPAVPVAGYLAAPLDSAVQLSWPVFPGVEAFYYKVHFGLQSGQYDEFTVTANHATSAVVRDLINGLPYYFSVVALDLTGREISALSPEFSATPGQVLHGAASSLTAQLGRVPRTGETGGEAFWIIALSLLTAAFLYSHKRRIVRG